MLIFLFLAIYSIALGFRIYWLSQKDSFMIDEGLSVTLASYNDYMWTKNYDLSREYTGKEVKEISLCDNDSLKNVFEDIFRLWKDNRDSPHTNLYYSFLRLSLAGLKTGDIKIIILRGGILNIFFFTLSFIFFFLLMRLLFPELLLMQYLAALCAFLSTGTITNTVLLRPYQLQETLFIVFCYFLFKTINEKKYIIQDKNIYLYFKTMFLLSAVTAVTLLTGYYSIILILLFGFYIIFINRKNHQEILYYVFILFLGLILAQSLYSRYFLGFIGYRSQETTATLFNDFFGNFIFSMNKLVSLFNIHFFTWITIALCLLCVFYLLIRKNKIIIQKNALCIFAVMLLYSVSVMLLAPYKEIRYILPVFPFLVILPVIIFNSIGKWKVSAAIMLLLCISFSVNASNRNNIEYLYQNKNESYSFNKDIDVPVFVLNNVMWKYADLIPYFNDEQKYFFIDSSDDIDLTQLNEFYFIHDASLEIPGFDKTQFDVYELGGYINSFFKGRKYIKNN